MTKKVYKSLLNILFVLCTGIGLFSSCQKDDKEIVSTDNENQLEKINFTTNPEQFSVTAKEGEYFFEVTTKAQNFTVSSSVSWITANVDLRNKNKVLFTVNENSNKEDREGRIILTSSDKKVQHSVIVSQKGRIGYILPFLNFGSTENEVINYEKKRQNQYSGIQSGDNTSIIKFPIFDDIFTEISYLITTKNYTTASLYGKKNVFSEQEKELFENFLIENHFEKRTIQGYANSLALSKTDKDVFVNENLQVSVELMNDKINFYLFKYFPAQQAAQPTIETLPFYIAKANVTSIQEYENTNNGTLNQEKTQAEVNRLKESDRASKDVYFYTSQDPNLIGRRYRLNKSGSKEGLYQTSFYYLEAKWALWQGKDGEYRLTKEFLNLADSQGFVFNKKSSSGTFLFKHKDENIKTKLSVVWRKDEIHDWSLRIDLY